MRLGVDCGKCTGTWNWSELVASGGDSSDIVLAGGAKVRPSRMSLHGSRHDIFCPYADFRGKLLILPRVHVLM